MMLDVRMVETARPPRFHRLRMLAEPWLYMSPTLILIGLFIFVPMMIGISYAFQNIQLLNPLDSGWVGLDNFREMFDDRRFFKALGAHRKLDADVIGTAVFPGARAGVVA
ncbi:hypothetical protein [Erwinia billingiae]|uniref:hypothetical protein n=1 Tax=Erwinia billingiae TaxID=182337 RepID=UPI000A701AD3|nr:hypothetical protein [Erwinia billingiae]